MIIDDTLYRCAECRCRRFIEGGTFVEVGIGNYDFICTACINRISRMQRLSKCPPIL